jgi:DNA-binding transcriptional ArsR family regulator
MELLRERPRAVGEIARELPISQPAVSQHLKVLKRAGLVVDRAVGTRRVYQLAPEGLAELHAYLEQFWTQALEGLKEAAERDDEEGKR